MSTLLDLPVIVKCKYLGAKTTTQAHRTGPLSAKKTSIAKGQLGWRKVHHYWTLDH